MTLRHMLNQLRSERTTIEQCEIIGRNLWTIGLRVQQQRKRVEKEIAEIKQRRKIQERLSEIP